MANGNYIDIRGARQNNLKNVSLKIDHEKLTVFSGVSGSGKSSLAFDTIFAEGQRRFVESQSTYARQFLARLDKPDVDSIEGLCPTIAVRSKNTYKNSRSTVGTVTEIYDYLRLVFSKIGTLHCPDCGEPVRALSVDEMLLDAIELFDGRKCYILAPLEISDKMTPGLLCDMVRARGYSYILSNGNIIDLETAAEQELQDAVDSVRKGKSQLYTIVDRLEISRKKKQRLGDSIETAVREGLGIFLIQPIDGEKKEFSARPLCMNCGTLVQRPTPQQLSFNSAAGACSHCKGFGDTYEIDMDAVVPDKSKTLREGALACWETRGIRRYARKMFKMSDDELGVRTDVPFSELNDAEINLLMKGGGELYGLEPFFERMKQKAYKVQNRYFLMRYKKLQTCSACGGSRLNPRALSVKIEGKSIADTGNIPVSEVYDFFSSLKLTKTERETVKLPLREIISRTGYLREIGLGYLTLWRLSRTLSGGEMQRIHLASHLGSRLTGSLYVLDEPTVGLHPRDTDRLIRVLEDIRDLGNTVLVVEHDLQVIRAADRSVDIGPGPGEKGGEIVFEGATKDFLKSKNSLTAQYLRGDKKVSDFQRKRPGGKPVEWLTVRGARQHNLKNIDVAFPLGRLTAVTGVSGSGKSTLVCDILYNNIAVVSGNDKLKPGECDSIDNIEAVDFVEMVGQEQVVHNPRANSLTYMDAFASVRAIFASTPQAKKKGLGPGAFSFNVAEGRCPKCEGTGFIDIDMQFLADVSVLCDECNGSRYQPHILEVKYEEKNIRDVLEMTANEALSFFAYNKRLVRKLRLLTEVGLGYIRLGQSLNTLSSGELQRLKIAKELDSSKKGAGLYIFDEPTMGLHPDEVGRLMICIDRLVSEGHTVIVIEHNLDVIAQADYVIDLGPEGGDAGGEIVVRGTPADVANHPGSITGRFLKELID